jgi:uncharacterized protein
MRTNRRQFVITAGMTAAFLGLQRYVQAAGSQGVIEPFGELLKDSFGVLDLPAGFSYRVLARRGKKMSDGFYVPGQPDGMAAFPGPDGKVILVCNHELGLKQLKWGPHGENPELPKAFDKSKCYDPGSGTEAPHVGGTSNIVFDPDKGEVVRHFLSLNGTDRNCAGGAMPWGSWITCEEPEDLTSERGSKHGWCFEVKATSEPGLQTPVPLKALGRFRHEAVSYDDRTGYLYLTEDRNDGLLYRFIPEKPKDFSKGRLQALVVKGSPSKDLRNYDPATKGPTMGEKFLCEWLDMKDTDSPKDDMRVRGFDAGAARFARGEGIHREGDSFFICCTDGGPSRRGQVFKLTPAVKDGEPDALELFVQPEKSDLLTNGDNICAAPWGGVVICEDLIDASFSSSTCVRGITPEGKIFTIARNAVDKSELAGCCFSPDGKWLFFNMQSLGLTVAVTGPWEKMRI